MRAGAIRRAPTSQRTAAAFVGKLRDAGLRQVTTNVSAVDANALAEELAGSGPRYAEGVFVTQIVPVPESRTHAIARFHEAMARHAPGLRPGFVALEGWVAAEILIEGLRRAGRELDTEKLVVALEGIRGLDVGIGARISFSPGDHQGSRQVWGTLLQPDGSWKQVALE